MKMNKTNVTINKTQLPAQTVNACADVKKIAVQVHEGAHLLNNHNNDQQNWNNILEDKIVA